jgi:gas vesicle protein
MSIRKLTDDLNIISSLPNRPTETSEELKAKFDEAGKIIKNYLNEVLTADTETEITRKVETATNLINQTISDLESSVETSITELNDEVSETINNLKEEIKTTTLNYTGFEITSHDSGTLNHGNGGSVTKTITATKSDYYPLAIVGFKSTSTNHYNNENMGACIQDLYLSKRSLGSCEITGKNYVGNNSAWTYSSTFTAYVLWVKVS